MKFTKEFLVDSLDDDEATVIDEITDTTRWSVCYRRVFKHDGKLYETHYSRGATECQDERPYEYENDEIECSEVEAVETMVIHYKPVAKVVS